ncbi:hypothetical protein CMO96_03830 [Candidatus Woesebacteria bacterium]|nr:hypothetical protein [Candidatus Woesebacteria bacterium]|tara:strand:- start:1141 stop:1851 length:711 start_codon:yes stop_codon:yes gene_type:complete
MNAKNTSVQATTQEHLLVAEIKDDIVLTKEGGAALVLRTSALNFALLSVKEQEAITLAYSSFLNSLAFPIQILVRSQKKDVSKYLKFLQEQEEKQQNEKLKEMMSSYQEFVSQVVKKKNVLEKEFYLILPFSPFELGISASGALRSVQHIALGVIPFTGKSSSSPKKGSVPFTEDYVIQKAKAALYPRRDHVIRQSGRMGMKVEQLVTEDLTKLFIGIYKKGQVSQNGKSQFPKQN